MDPQFIGESFLITFREKQYGCRAIKANDRMLYQVDFNGSCLYLTRALNQHRIPFWTTIPQDLKLRQVAYELGNQIENHFN
jgi:hypothetical protein